MMSNSLSAPSPTLPRKRERERASFLSFPLPLAGEGVAPGSALARRSVAGGGNLFRTDTADK